MTGRPGRDDTRAGDRGFGGQARARAAPNDGVVANGAVSGQHDVIRKNDVVADAAVVPDMAVGEKRATIADRRHRPAAFRAGVHRHPFANDAVVADRQ